MQKGHLTKDQKAEMQAREDALRCPISAEPPVYLENDGQVGRFCEIAELLTSVDDQLCTALDADQLARYVISEQAYLEYSKALRRALKVGDFKSSDAIQRQQDKAFKQVQACANALGMNVTSRLKIDLPVRDVPKRNKFADGLD